MHFDIMVGSVLGASEYVAEALLSEIEEAGYGGQCHFTPHISALNKENILIICSSTHGAGDLPDNIQAFADDLAKQDLKGLKAIIIGLGDSSYDTYCGAAMQFERLLCDKGAVLLSEPFLIDVLNHPIPEDIAVEWLSEQLKSINK